MNTDELQERMPERVRASGFEFRDRLAVAGTAVGVLLVLVGLATVVGTPWTHKGSVVAAAVQVVGALATAAVGAGLVWFAQLDGRR